VSSISIQPTALEAGLRRLVKKVGIDGGKVIITLHEDHSTKVEIRPQIVLLCDCDKCQSRHKPSPANRRGRPKSASVFICVDGVTEYVRTHLEQLIRQHVALYGRVTVWVEHGCMQRFRLREDHKAKPEKE
jgi:hypothetical protein